MQHLKGGLPADLDPLQSAYRHIVQQKVQYLIHCSLLHHTWKAGTLNPGEEKLISLNIDTGTCNWTLNFLTQRGTTKPNTVSTVSWAPYWSVYSQRYRQFPHQPHLKVCWWDSVGLLSNNAELAYRAEAGQRTARRWITVTLQEKKICEARLCITVTCLECLSD